MGKNIYLYEDNAEEILMDAVESLKNKVARDSRNEAFEDCTKYWKDEIEKVMNDGSPNGAKLSRIRSMFNISFQDKE